MRADRSGRSEIDVDFDGKGAPGGSFCKCSSEIIMWTTEYQMQDAAPGVGKVGQADRVGSREMAACFRLTMGKAWTSVDSEVLHGRVESL